MQTRFGTTMQAALFATVAATRISRRVAVIGGGSGGVVAARFLKRAGHKPTIFEAGEQFGGVWADAPTNDVVYKDLQTNLPTAVMQSPDLDFPAGLPSYIDKPMLGRYIAQYATTFGVAEDARFGTKVDSVEAADEAWRVRWSERDGATHTETYDAVIVANGHYEEPYAPPIPGDDEWLAADASREIIHSRAYDDASAFRDRSVLVVGGRSSGVDISRMLHGVAKWTYVLEKGCAGAVEHAGQAVTHVPLGTRLGADGKLRLDDGAVVSGSGPPVDRVVLATGYVYSFPFLDEQALGMEFRGKRWVTPLYEHLQHARRPTLGFIGIPLAVPCPIPFFECQAAYLAEAWSRPPGEELTSEAERDAWVAARLDAVGFDRGRPQDTHLTGAAGGSAWTYMRELLGRVHAARPPTADGASWLERSDWEARLETVESVYRDRGARYPKRPWDDDAYRRCEYDVDWEAGTWTVDDSRAKAVCEPEPAAAAAA